MKRYWLIPVFILFPVIIIWNMPAGEFSETLPAIIEIAEEGQIGIHTTREPQKMFNFGTTFPDTKVQKTINLTTGKEPPAKVHITINGQIQNWTTLSNNDFVLDKFTQVMVTVSVPEDSEKGKYAGNITIDYTSTYGIRFLDSIKQFFN